MISYKDGQKIREIVRGELIRATQSSENEWYELADFYSIPLVNQDAFVKRIQSTPLDTFSDMFLFVGRLVVLFGGSLGSKEANA